MKGISLLVLTAAALLFSGCSSKQYFEPEQTFSAGNAVTSYGSKIVSLTRDGATLENGQYIGRNGIGKINLGKDYRFLSESGVYLLAGDLEGKLKIINKRSGKVLRTVDFEVPIVSASIHNGIVVQDIGNDTVMNGSGDDGHFEVDGTEHFAASFVDDLQFSLKIAGKEVGTAFAQESVALPEVDLADTLLADILSVIKRRTVAGKIDDLASV